MSFSRLREILLWLAPYGLRQLCSDYLIGNDRHNMAAPYLLPEETLEELFPGIGEMEMAFVPFDLQAPTKWGLELKELLTLKAICQFLRPSRIFEFGTHEGYSSLAMAQACAESQIYTLDLVDYGHRAFQGERIHALLGDSQDYDFAPYYGKMDLVFVDAGHFYRLVRRDSENAFKMVRPGGCIVWDDYVFGSRRDSGVKHALEELYASRPDLRRIRGTRMAICPRAL